MAATYDDDIRRLAEAALRCRRRFSASLAVQDIQHAADCLAPGLRPAERRATASSAWKSRPIIAHGHRGDDRRSAGAVGGGRPAQSDGQGAGDAGRLARHPRSASAQGSTSTSHCCSRAACIRRWRKPTSTASKCAPQGRGPRHIASVASFFVSRIDTMVDKEIDDKHRRRATDEDGLKRNRAARSRSPTPSSPISTTSRCSPARAGRRWRKAARGRSGCCGPPPARRTKPIPTSLYVGFADRTRHGQHHAAGNAWMRSAITARAQARLEDDVDGAKTVSGRARAAAASRSTTSPAELVDDGVQLSPKPPTSSTARWRTSARNFLATSC